jgi:hypothetical protein
MVLVVVVLDGGEVGRPFGVMFEIADVVAESPLGCV